MLLKTHIYVVVDFFLNFFDVFRKIISTFEKLNLTTAKFDRLYRTKSIIMNLLQNLNEKQKEAVTTIDGNIRVTAGAGSGKTRVLAHRYAFLVNEVGISPSSILCMTFTNKAAQEMKNRISTMVREGNVNDFVCTIHGFCVKFLREEIFRIGYPKNFVIIDAEDSKDLAKQVLKEFGIDNKATTIRQFLNGISKRKHLNPNYIKEEMLPNASSKNKDEFEFYLHLQLKSFALDFDDLILFSIYILTTYPSVRKKWQGKLNYIMVDEAQDCNGYDWELIELLRGDRHNLFFVGDPDQCIYEWRGATPNAFINYKPDKDFILDQNYRSTPNILGVANSVISYNKNRIKKELYTANKEGKIVIYYHAQSDQEEGEWIAKQIKSMVNENAKYSDFAILYRASFLSRFIEQALLQEHIAYTIWGGIRFFERKEVKDALAYLRLLTYHDDISLRRIINVPSRKFGPQSLVKLTKLSQEDGISLYEALVKHVSEFRKESLLSFIKLFDYADEYKKNHSISDTLDLLLNKSGYKYLLRVDDDQERLDNLEELLNSIKYYEQSNKDDDISIEKYLQDIALYTNADYKKDTPTVKLMTIHQAKGLEFPYVFVCGLTEGVFPSHRAIREGKGKALEEERRLMYVAITRAERALFLTDSEGYSYMNRCEKYPSRFLSEIKENLIKVEGHVDASLLEGTKQTVRDLEYELEDRSVESFSVGDLVSNKYFGIGKVISCDNKNHQYDIEFTNGTRTLSGWSIKKTKRNTAIKDKEINDSAVLVPFLYVSSLHYYDTFMSKLSKSMKMRVRSNRNDGYRIGSYQISLTSSIYQDSDDKFYKIISEIAYESNNRFHLGSIVQASKEIYQIIKVNGTSDNPKENTYEVASFTDGTIKEMRECDFTRILFIPIVGGFYKILEPRKYVLLKNVTYNGAKTVFHFIYSGDLRSHNIELDKICNMKFVECSRDTFIKYCADKKKFHEIERNLFNIV